MTMETMDMSLMRMLREGPEVSLKGSPTVSPTTVAWWEEEFLPPKWPSSTYFFALSQAPPELARKMARTKPAPRPPARRPITPAGPSSMPTSMGTTIARIEGKIISCCAALVEMRTQEV